MIDIHSHLIFDVDDGSKSLEQSLEYLNQIKKMDLDKVVCTPHIKEGNKEFASKVITNFKILREEASRIGINLYLGNEIMLSSNIVGILKSRKLLGINNSNYILLEFKRTETMSIEILIGILEDIIECGYKIILAHPEFYENYLNVEYIKRIKELGVLLQMDATSIFKLKTNRKIHKFSKKLLKEKLIDIVASDSHCTKKRDFLILEKAYQKIKRNHGEHYTNIIFYENPLEILGQ